MLSALPNVLLIIGSMNSVVRLTDCHSKKIKLKNLLPRLLSKVEATDPAAG